METKDLVPLSIAEVERIADTAMQSGMFPSLKSKQGAFTLMMICQAEGLHPIQALRRFDVIDGKPALKTDAMLAEFQGRGGSVQWLDYSAEAVSAEFHAPGLRAPVTVKWTLDDAKRAGLAGKNNWKTYPRQMLRARVVSEGIRMAMPAVVVGLYTPEEVQDFEPIERKGPGKAAVEYTPPQPKPAAVAAQPARGGHLPESEPAVVDRVVRHQDLRALMIVKHEWPIARCKSWLIKYFGTNALSELSDAQAADAAAMLEARTKSEEDYEGVKARLAAEGRILAQEVAA